MYGFVQVHLTHVHVIMTNIIECSLYARYNAKYYIWIILLNPDNPLRQALLSLFYR